jgi:hypothetical protein
MLRANAELGSESAKLRSQIGVAYPLVNILFEVAPVMR